MVPQCGPLPSSCDGASPDLGSEVIPEGFLSAGICGTEPTPSLCRDSTIHDRSNFKHGYACGDGSWASHVIGEPSQWTSCSVLQVLDGWSNENRATCAMNGEK